MGRDLILQRTAVGKFNVSPITGIIHTGIGNRAGLEKVSCDCYAVIQQNLDKVFLARASLQ
jgi:hypothetical protein